MMNEPGDREPSTPGRILKSERLRQQLSRTEVSRALHLPRSVIDRIEQDRLDELAAVYRRGYLANYARYLKLDPEPILAGVEGAETTALKAVLPIRNPGYRFERFLKIATYVLATTVIVPPLVVFFVMGGSRIFERDIAPAEGLELSAEGSAASRMSERVARALALDAAPAGEQGHLSASTLPLRVSPPIGEAAAKPLEPDSEDPEAGEALPGTEPESDPYSSLILDLSGDSWVEIFAADGERLEFDLLRSGTRRHYEGRPPFSLLLGRGEMVRLELDGEPVALDEAGGSGLVRLELGGPAAPES